MAAGTIYKVTAGQLGANPFVGILDITVTKAGSVVETMADGANTPTKTYVQKHTRHIAVRLESNAGIVSLTPGQIGKLSFTLAQQADGTGPVVGGNETLNYPASASTGYATLVGFSGGAPYQGNPTVSVNFVVNDGAGDPTLLEELVA